MPRLPGLRLVFASLIGLSVHGLAGAPASAVARLDAANFGETSPKLREGGAVTASASEYVAVERFLSEIEKPPVTYQARRRLEASAAKLKESAWLEAATEYDLESGFRYSIVAQGGSERIQRRVLRPVLEAERKSSARDEWTKTNLSRANYDFNFSGRAGDGMLKMQLNPRRRDVRLVNGAALLTADSGDLVRVEGRLSKSPSFWERWVDVSRSYAPIGGAMMPVAVESTADVRIAGLSTFSMTYDYQMVDGVAVTTTPRMLASR